MSENPSSAERIGGWVRQSLTVKLISIGFLILILLIPMMMIGSLVKEREHRRNATVREISNTWGNAQTVAGPVLTIPYQKYHITEDEDGKNKKTVTTTHYAHFLPNALDIKSKVIPEIRYRGIYEAILYNTEVSFKGNFDAPNFEAMGISGSDRFLPLLAEVTSHGGEPGEVASEALQRRKAHNQDLGQRYRQWWASWLRVQGAPWSLFGGCW